MVFQYFGSVIWIYNETVIYHHIKTLMLFIFISSQFWHVSLLIFKSTPNWPASRLRTRLGAPLETSIWSLISKSRLIWYLIANSLYYIFNKSHIIETLNLLFHKHRSPKLVWFLLPKSLKQTLECVWWQCGNDNNTCAPELLILIIFL